MTILKAIEIYIASMEHAGTPVKAMALALKPNVYLIFENELRSMNHVYGSVACLRRRLKINGVTVCYKIAYQNEQDRFVDLPEDKLFNSIFQ